jgi:hypothetical protein
MITIMITNKSLLRKALGAICCLEGEVYPSRIHERCLSSQNNIDAASLAVSQKQTL